MKKIIDMLKSMTNSKKKVFALALATCVIVLSIASSSIAYFTDTKEYTNTFTSGNVAISLTEAVAVRNTTSGDVEIADVNDRIAFNANSVYGKLFPKQNIAKDPIIKNTGSEKAYFGATVTLSCTNIKSILADEAAVKQFIIGLPTSGVTIDIDDDVITIYIIYSAQYATNDEAKVFTGIKILDEWNNTQMSVISGLKIDVKAYAVQIDGFANADEALYAAFDTVFPNPNP